MRGAGNDQLREELRFKRERVDIGEVDLFLVCFTVIVLLHHLEHPLTGMEIIPVL